MTENRQETDSELIKSKEALAGYLAVHHHQSNLAMMFVNPSIKVRLLLSYVLIGLRQEANVFVECTFHRSVIDQCHLKVQGIIEQFEAEEITGDIAERMVALYEQKATSAHGKLMELANARN